MSLLGYRLGDIREAHIQDLCQRKEAESFYIEYKKEMYKKGDFQDELEMVRDVVAFANAAGGDIIVGVEEEGAGVPKSVCGIDEAESHRDWMMRVLIAAIQPRIPGLTPRVLPLESGRSVLILRIPRSPLCPHMVMLRGHYEFWRRHDRNKSAMSVEEIRQACLETDALRQRAEDFLASRARQLKGVCVGNAWLVVSTTPMLLRENLIDPFGPPARELILEPPPEAGGPFALDFGAADDFLPMPTLRGSVRTMVDEKCLEVWTNGYCEFRFNLFSLETGWQDVPSGGVQLRILDADPILYMCKGFFAFARRLYEACGYLGQLAVSLSIVNAERVSLRAPFWGPSSLGVLSGLYAKHLADAKDIALPHKLVLEPSGLGDAVRPILDTLWRAYHWESCPCFNEKAEVVPDPQRPGRR